MSYLRIIASQNLSKPSTSSSDAFDVNPVSGLVAISDGVTNSIFPDVWAKLLVTSFCRTTAAELDALFSLEDIDSWLEPIRKQWSTEVQSIIDQNDFEPEITNRFLLKKPAAATFIGIQFFNRSGGDAWRALIVGDSVLMQIRNNRILGSYLISKSSEFSQRTNAITSYRMSNVPLQMVHDDMKRGDLFLLATDALGKWLLQLSESGEGLFAKALELITGMQEPAEFERFVVQQRLDRKRRLDLDDTSFILIDPNPEAELLEYLPDYASEKDEALVPIIPALSSNSENDGQIANTAESVESHQMTKDLFRQHRRLVSALAIGAMLILGLVLVLLVGGNWDIHKWNSTETLTNTPIVPSKTPRDLQPLSTPTMTTTSTQTLTPTGSATSITQRTPTDLFGNTPVTPTNTPSLSPTIALSITPGSTATQIGVVDFTLSPNGN